MGDTMESRTAFLTKKGMVAGVFTIPKGKPAKLFLKNLTEEQKQLVKSFCAGPLLDFDCSEAPRYILGIPIGDRTIQTKASKAVKEIISSNIVERLFTLVNKDLIGDKFVRVFMLITMSFLCPTSCGSASMHHYSRIAVVEDIPKYDRCSLVLDWLIDAIHKFQTSFS
ncbi:hypothetical protein BS78_09G023100 [Paspalum vaginatum]|nr:hypothetical protein BS78_09G023100 [Paspalum vaginatum]